MLGALAPRDPHRTARAQTGQHHLHHGRLANPGFATEQDALARALGRPLEALRDGLDVVQASNEGAGRPRGWGLAVVAQVKPIALPADRGEIPRRGRHIAQHLANLVYTHPQHRIADMRPRPHVLPQLRFGHQAAGMRHQIAQHRQGLGPQGDRLVALPQTAVRAIQMEQPKRAVVSRLHGAPCVET